MPKIYFECEGRLGKEPEIKFTKDNTTLARLSIAVNEYYKTKKGEWEQKGETSWINGAAFGYPAEVIESLELESGARVFAKGTMRQSVWEDEDGEEQKGWDFYINKLYEIPNVDFDDDEEDERPRKKSRKSFGSKSRKGSRRKSRGSKKSGKYDLSSLKSGKKSKSKGNLAASIAKQLANK